MQYARILDGVAVDVCADPAAQFHPQLAAQFEAVPGDVAAGSRLVDGVWQAPTPLVPGPVPVTAAVSLSPVDFMLRFMAPERVAARASTDPIVTAALPSAVIAIQAVRRRAGASSDSVHRRNRARSR